MRNSIQYQIANLPAGFCGIVVQLGLTRVTLYLKLIRYASLVLTLE